MSHETTSSSRASHPVVVLGAAGRLGRELVHAALRLGQPVTAVARSREKLRETLQVADHPLLTLAEADARDAEAMAAVMKGASAVVNSAGMRETERRSSSWAAPWFRRRSASSGPVDGSGSSGARACCASRKPDRLGIDLAGMPAMYQTHRANHETLRASSLDWSMLCPGPMVDSADRPAVDTLRISTEILPFEVDVSDVPDDARLFALLRERLPETTIPYATAAEVGDAPPGEERAVQPPAGGHCSTGGTHRREARVDARPARVRCSGASWDCKPFRGWILGLQRPLYLLHAGDGRPSSAE